MANKFLLIRLNLVLFGDILEYPSLSNKYALCISHMEKAHAYITLGRYKLTTRSI